MSESDNVQRVRVVDQWAVKTAKGDYLDANAVSVINGLVIVLLIALTLFWMGVAYTQWQAMMFVNGPDIIHWEPVMLGRILIVIFNFISAATHLVGVNLIVRHSANAAFLLQAFCVVIAVGGILQAGEAIAVGSFTLPVYIVIGALMGIIKPYFRR